MLVKEKTSTSHAVNTLDKELVFRPEPQKIRLLTRNFNLFYRKPFQWLLKRVFDFTAGLTGTLAISPLLILIAVLIKIDSKGPVIFKQTRVGMYGKKYTMYKFRSMKEDAEKQLDNIKNLNETNELMFKMFEDPRVTKLGKFLRKYSLDELPQLFNVIKGQMSLVGPRPSLVSEVEKYQEHHYLRFGTLPGLTGVWQVSGRSNIKKFDTVVRMDYEYINNWNFLTDIKLLLKTIPVILFAKDSA